MKTLKLHVSPGNIKLGTAIPNVSGLPVKDCDNCDACKQGDCYALKALRRPNVRKAWTENSKLLRADMDSYFNQLTDYFARKRTYPRFFRINTAGDLLNQKHLDMWCQFCSIHEETKFLVFTKRHSRGQKHSALKFRNIPDSLSIVFSMFPTMPMPEVKGYPIAWVTRDRKGNIEKRIPDNAIECPGNCESCGMCWELSNIERDVFFHLH